MTPPQPLPQSSEPEPPPVPQELLGSRRRWEQGHQTINIIQQTPPPQYYHNHQRNWNPAIALLLSFFFPGLGQLYKQQTLAFFFWMIATTLGYICFILPGLFLHFICIVDAACSRA